MIKNNYDTNSKGRSIEVMAFYDTSESQRLFNESFEVMQHSSRGESSHLFYINLGNLPGADSVKISITSPLAEIVRFLADSTCFESEEILTWTEEERESEVFGQLSTHPTIYNLDKLSEESGLEFTTSKPVQSIRVTGFCQGDLSHVHYCPDDLLSVWGKAPSENELRDSFQNLIYSAPIYARVTVDGEEYFYELDSYDWKREEFAESVAKQSGATEEEILALLPVNLDYV